MQVVALAAQATATLRTHELGASGVRVLFTFETLANGGILFSLLVAVGAAGVVSFKTGLFGRRFGAVSVLLAVASGAGAFSIAYAKLENLQSIVLPLDGVWILVVSIMLLVQPERRWHPVSNQFGRRRRWEGWRARRVARRTCIEGSGGLVEPCQNSLGRSGCFGGV